MQLREGPIRPANYRSKRQNLSTLLLRLGLYYPGKKTWGPAHMNWLTALKLDHREQRIAADLWRKRTKSGT
jgi:hypothetical protein